MDTGTRVRHRQQPALTGAVTDHDGATITVRTDHDGTVRTWPAHTWEPTHTWETDTGCATTSTIRLSQTVTLVLADYIRDADPDLASHLTNPTRCQAEGRGRVFYHALDGGQRRDLGRYTTDYLADMDNGRAPGRGTYRRDLIRALERILNLDD